MLVAVTVLVGRLLVADLVLGAVGQSVAAAVRRPAGPDRRRHRRGAGGLSRDPGALREVHRRRRRPGHRLRRGRLPGRVFRRGRGRLHRLARRMSRSLQPSTEPAAPSGRCWTSIPGPRGSSARSPRSRFRSSNWPSAISSSSGPASGSRVDGTVVRGRSAVDQAVLTGESMPVDKGEGDPVYTGTVNQFGRLEVRAEKLGAETTLGQVLRLLAEANRHRSPLERTADRLRPPVPSRRADRRGCGLPRDQRARPCGEGSRGGVCAGDRRPCRHSRCSSSPARVPWSWRRRRPCSPRRPGWPGGASWSRAARRSRRLARVDTMAFDKTGTLTEGKPELGDLHRIGSRRCRPRRRVLRLAAAAEQPSEHPLARMLVAEARRRELALPPVVEFQAQPGAGILATIRPAETEELATAPRRQPPPGPRAGSGRSRPRSRRPSRSSTAPGRRPLIVVRDGRIVGLIGARDRVRRVAHDVDPRPEAPGTQGPGDPHRRPHRPGAGRRQEGAYQAGGGRADARRQGGVDRAASGRRAGRGDGRRRHQRRAGPGPGRRRAGDRRRGRRPRGRGRLGRPDGRPARGSARDDPPGPPHGPRHPPEYPDVRLRVECRLRSSWPDCECWGPSPRPSSTRSARCWYC